MAEYCVLGATGKVGGVVVRTLLSQGKHVRVVVRDVNKFNQKFPSGASVVQGSLEDVASLTHAFSGVAGLFVLTPPLLDSLDPVGENARMLANIITAVNQAKVPKIVYLSSVGAQHSSGLGAISKLYDLEQGFKKLDIPTLSLRAAWFLENFLSQFGHGSNQLLSFIHPDLSIPMIATQDIGEAAAGYLQEDWKGHRTVELHGPKNYTTIQIAEEASGFYGFHITAVPVPPEQYAAYFRKFGFTEVAANLMSEMDNGFNSGHISFEGGLEEYRGKLSLTDVLKAQ